MPRKKINPLFGLEESKSKTIKKEVEKIPSVKKKDPIPKKVEKKIPVSKKTITPKKENPLPVKEKKPVKPLSPKPPVVKKDKPKKDLPSKTPVVKKDKPTKPLSPKPPIFKTPAKSPIPPKKENLEIEEEKTPTISPKKKEVKKQVEPKKIKHKLKIGDRVIVTFLGTPSEGTIIELSDEGKYKVKSDRGIILPRAKHLEKGETMDRYYPSYIIGVI